MFPRESARASPLVTLGLLGARANLAESELPVAFCLVSFHLECAADVTGWKLCSLTVNKTT